MLSFLAPAALAAAVMAAVPVAIHLLTSRASVRRDFPALAFCGERMPARRVVRYFAIYCFYYYEYWRCWPW